MTDPAKLRAQIDEHVGSYTVPLDAPERAHRFLDRLAEERGIPYPDAMIGGDSKQGGPEGIGLEWWRCPGKRAHLLAIPFAGEDGEELYLSNLRGWWTEVEMDLGIDLIRGHFQ